MVDMALTGPMADALAAFRSRLPPETGTDFDNLLSDVFAAGKAAAETEAAAVAPKVPILGKVAASIAKSMIDKGLDDAQAEIETFFAGVLEAHK